MPTASHPLLENPQHTIEKRSKVVSPLKPSVSNHASSSTVPPAVSSASASPRTSPSRWRSVFSVTTRWPKKARRRTSPSSTPPAGRRQERGLNHFGHEGLVRRVVGGRTGGWYRSCRSSRGERIGGYNLPQGVITHLFRDIAGGKRWISRVGLGTFVDPRYGGGQINDCTRNLVSLINVGGEDYLMYKTFPVNVGIIRGTTADPDGNITMEKET
ncbi:MAG: CoA-transferase [Rhodocyclaceae bacterium]